MSYTRFDYSDLRIEHHGVPAARGIHVTVRVKNSGARSGDEVSQLYVAFPKIPGVPLIALRGFQRVNLRQGESKEPHFELSPRDLSSVGADGTRLVTAGDYSIFEGSGQPGTGVAAASDKFSTTSPVPLPR